jgi:hypothetical protein
LEKIHVYFLKPPFFPFTTFTVTDGPDLVSTCAGILDVGNSDSDQEYEEIETILSEFPKLSIHGPALPSSLNRAEGVMGQNISLRRPRISLTWVLRENVSQSNPQQSSTLPDRKRSSQSPQKERMFSEKYVSDQKSTEDQKVQYDKYSDGRNAYLSHDHKNEHVRKLPRNRSDLDKAQSRVAVQASPNYTLPDLKKTTSVPALSTKSFNGSELSVHDGQKRRRRRRDRGYSNRRFGYEINNVEEFLTKVTCKTQNLKKLIIHEGFYNVSVFISFTSKYSRGSGFKNASLPNTSK